MAEIGIGLNADQSAVAEKHIRDVQTHLGLLWQLLESGKPLSPELARSALRVSEHTLRELANTLGIETDGTKEAQERYGLLRAANEKVRELEGRIGAAQSAQDIQLGARKLLNQLTGWWRMKGLGHTVEMSVERYGVHAKFSGMLFGSFSLLRSKTPVSDKDRKLQWFEALKAQGFVLAEDEDRDMAVIDCDTSRAALRLLLTTYLPSAKVLKVESREGRNGVFVLGDIEVFIQDIADVEALPVPEVKTETAPEAG